MSVKYGIQLNTGFILNYTRRKNKPYTCSGEYTYELVNYETDYGYWLVDDHLTAEYVRNISTEWYNSDEEQPTYSLQFYNKEKDDYDMLKDISKVIKVTTLFEDIEPFTLPTVEQYLRVVYVNDPKHLEQMLSNLTKSTNIGRLSFHYSRYDLVNYFNLLKKQEKTK